MKNLARILAMALVVVMVLSLAGCGAASKIKGEWKASVMGIPMTMEFDGKEVTTSVMGEEETFEYEVKGDKLVIDGEETAFEFDGRNTLILDMDGMEVEFERQ